MKPVAIVSTDWHLKPDNIELKKRIIIQQCEEAEKLGIKEHICCGDVFESRKAQELSVLSGFEDILDVFRTYGHNLTVIAGNHDKTNYDSDTSFLSPHRHHPAITLVETPYYTNTKEFPNLFLYFMPFWKDDVYLEKLKDVVLRKDKVNILFSHTAINGSVNNDGSKVSDSRLNAETFKDFDLVILGHYHNASQPAKNIYHIPSLNQTNFGEDEDKGFTVVYDDLSMKRIQPNAPKFYSVKVDMDTTTKKELDKLIETHSGSSDRVRFILSGDEKVIKSVPKEKLAEAGIKVEYKQTSVSENEDTEFVEDVSELQAINKESIKDSFEAFMESEKIKDSEKDLGRKYVNSKLHV